MPIRIRPARRPGVIATFTLSWDGRILEKGQPEMGVDEFRELLAAGGIDELRIAWQPRLTGGKAHPPVTGFDPAFLPRGIALELLKLQRKGDGCVAQYRVRRTRV
jgi:riboflavin biosynthesis pyrimidine reductase